MPDVWKAVLLALFDYFDAIEDCNGQLPETRITSLKTFGVNPGIARAGLQWLEDNELLSRRVEQDEHQSWTTWELTPNGAEFANQLAIRRKAEIAGFQGDDSYSPIEIDRTDKEVTELIDVTEELVEKIRGNNGLAQPQKTILLTSLNSGLAVIKSSYITKAQITSLILQPLKWAMTQFAKAEIGELAKRAHDLAKTLLSLW